LRLAVEGRPEEPLLPSLEKMHELVSSYSRSIGDVEQSLEGEDVALDPLLLRQTDSSHSIPHRPPPESATFETDAPSPRGDELPADSEKSPGNSLTAKREILERAIRQRMKLP